MPLQKFRDRQKIIYWLVALIVVPSFVLLGFSGAFMSAPPPEVGKYFGKKCTAVDFEQFQRRLYGVNRGRPAYFVRGNPMTGEMQPICSAPLTAFLLLALIDDASRHGVEICDEEIATFIRAQIKYTGKDNAEFRRVIQQQLDHRSIPLNSIFEYQQAVREILTARKYLALIDNSLIIPRAFAELQFVQEDTEYSYQRVFVGNKEQQASAEKAINDLPETELLSRAEIFIRERQNAQNRHLSPFLWEKPRWQLEYITLPITPLAVNPNAEKIDEEQIKTAKENQQTEAREIFKREFGEFMRRKIRDSIAQEQTTVAPITLAEINADERLRKIKLTAGNTGEQLLTTEEIFATDALKDFSAAALLLNYLDMQICRQTDNAKDLASAQEAANNILQPYQKSFRGYPSMTGTGEEIPLQGETGLLNFRVTQYASGAPRRLQNATADGMKTDADLLKEVKTALINEAANAQAMQKALEIQIALRDGKTVENITTDKKKFNELNSTGLAKLRGTNVGNVLAPQLVTQPEIGFEVLQLTAIEIPKIAGALDNSKIDRLQEYLTMSWRSGQEYAPEKIDTPLFLLGTRLGEYLQSLLNSGDIAYDKILDNRE